MAVDRAVAKPKPRRADACRNRESILRAARKAFEADGALASLDGIAVRAGVGNATLYRNFPTREDLLAAVMEVDLADARAEAEALATRHAPCRALAEWLVWLTWRLRIWHDLPGCVAKASGDHGSSLSPTTSHLMRLTTELLAGAQAAGTAPRSIEPREVFELATAMSWAIDRFGDDENAARRRVAVATAGLFT